jgi:hypothetical protein
MKIMQRAIKKIKIIITKKEILEYEEMQKRLEKQIMVETNALQKHICKVAEIPTQPESDSSKREHAFLAIRHHQAGEEHHPNLIEPEASNFKAFIAGKARGKQEEEK